jgi:iron complex transport system substrate-binding protein
MKRWLILLIGLLLSLAWARYPITVRDDLGQLVTLKAPPMRIISMIPSVTETLCAMGDCSRLVGVDSYSDWPPQVNHLPKLGGLYNPNPEAILALKPDLVFVSVYGKLDQTLRRAGVTVFAIRDESWTDVDRVIRLLGTVLQQPAQAEELIARINDEIDHLEALVANRPHPRVYLEIDPTPYTVGPNSFMGVLLAKAGGDNIIPASLGLFPQINPELVVEKNPQVILLTDGVTLAQLRSRPGWAEISAIQHDRVCSFTGSQADILSRPGPRIPEALELMIGCLYPGIPLPHLSLP